MQRYLLADAVNCSVDDRFAARVVHSPTWPAHDITYCCAHVRHAACMTSISCRNVSQSPDVASQIMFRPLRFISQSLLQKVNNDVTICSTSHADNCVNGVLGLGSAGRDMHVVQSSRQPCACAPSQLSSVLLAADCPAVKNSNAKMGSSRFIALSANAFNACGSKAWPRAYTRQHEM